MFGDFPEHQKRSGDEEAIIINKEETDSSRGKERLLSVKNVHAHTRTNKLRNSNRGFLRKIYFSTNYRIVREKENR